MRAKARHFRPSCAAQYWGSGRLSFECKHLILSISLHFFGTLLCGQAPNLPVKPTQEAIRCLSGSHQGCQNPAAFSSQLTLLPLPTLRSKTHCQVGCGDCKTFGTECYMIPEDTGSWKERSSCLLRRFPKGWIFFNSLFSFFFPSLHLAVDFVDAM